MALEELPHDARRVHFLLRPRVTKSVDANHPDLCVIATSFVAHGRQRARGIFENDLEVAAVVSRRTPGFSGWQQERWWTHCGDAAQFLGPAGHTDLETKWSRAVPSLMMDAGMEGETWLEYFAELDAEGSPTAYVFRCRQCGQLGGYSDCD